MGSSRRKYGYCVNLDEKKKKPTLTTQQQKLRMLTCQSLKIKNVEHDKATFLLKTAEVLFLP